MELRGHGNSSGGNSEKEGHWEGAGYERAARRRRGPAGGQLKWEMLWVGRGGWHCFSS